jgi:hypothetical protein
VNEWGGNPEEVQNLPIGQHATAYAIINYIFELHDDDSENNIGERVREYGALGFELQNVEISKITAEWMLSDEKVDEYAKMTSPAPPVVLDKYLEVIDGTHRVHAALDRGESTIKAFVPIKSKSRFSSTFLRERRSHTANYSATRFTNAPIGTRISAKELLEWMRPLHWSTGNSAANDLAHYHSFELQDVPISQINNPWVRALNVWIGTLNSRPLLHL